MEIGNNELIAIYSNIESQGKLGIAQGRVVGNPLARGRLSERIGLEHRYSISAQGLLYGSPVHSFLVKAMSRVGAVEPNVALQPTSSLHLTFTEVTYNSSGKKAAGVNAEVIFKYHQALREYFPDYQRPVQINLHKIFTTLDTPESATTNGSLVAAFLTNGEPTVFQVRKDIELAVKSFNQGEKEPLAFNPAKRDIKVIFVTLGRFIGVPTRVGDEYPIQETIAELNQEIPYVDSSAKIGGIQLITTATSYILGQGYLFVDPPVTFRRNELTNEPARFVRLSQRS